MRIEKRETYAETCERVRLEHEKRPATFELLPRADDLQPFDVVVATLQNSHPVEILISDCYTSVNRWTGVVGFALGVGEIVALARQVAEGRTGSSLFADTRGGLHYSEAFRVFYVKDALEYAEEFANHSGQLGWKPFLEWVKRSNAAEEQEPEFWYVKMIECGIDNPRSHYDSRFNPSNHSLTSAMILAQMIEWMGKDPAFDRRSLQTQNRVCAVRRAINLIDRREVSEAEGRDCHEELLSSLAEDDRFWMKWRAFGRRNGWWE